MDTIEQRLAALDREQRELLDLMQREHCADAAPLKRGPVSFAQERMWVLHQLNPDVPLYNIPGAVQLDGELQPALLEQMFNLLIERHETLRTCFIGTEGEITQLVQPPFTLAIPFVDLSARPQSERDNKLAEILRAAAQYRFHLDKTPLIHVTLIRLSPTRHVVSLVMHHIISDGWSAGILVREMASIYDCISRGKQSSLAPLPLQYIDYSLQQNQLVHSRHIQAQEQYWLTKLKAPLPLLSLPTDRQRPQHLQGQGEQYLSTFPAGLSRDISALSRKHGVTEFAVLLTAYKIVLHLYSGQSDLVVGFSTANRHHANLEALSAALSMCWPFVPVSIVATGLSIYCTGFMTTPLKPLLTRIFPSTDCSSASSPRECPGICRYFKRCLSIRIYRRPVCTWRISILHR